MSVRGPAIQSSAGGLPATGPVLEVRSRATSRRGWIGLVGLLLAGLIVSIAAAHTESFLPESVRPVPGSLAGVFGPAGVNLHVAGAIAVLVLMFASYMRVVSLSGELSPRLVILSIGLLHAFVLLAPPLISTDVFSYQAYARMGAHYGVNPYLNGPYAIRFDSVFPYVGAKWSYIPSAYGPLFTGFSYLLAPLSIAASVLVYKSIAAGASLALVVVIWQCARLRGHDPVRAAALVGLNPLLVVYGVGGGHNDLLMLLALAGSLDAVLAGRERSGGALSMLAIGIKLTAGLALPFAFVECVRSRRRRRDLVIGAAAGFTLIAGFSVAVFGSGAFHLLDTVRQSQSEGDWKSIPGVIGDRLGLPGVGHVVGYTLAAAFVGASVWLLVRVWRGTMDWIDGAGWATLAMLLGSSSLLPWYVGWMLPLAALARDVRLQRMVLVMTGVVQGIQLLGYIPHG
jgi:alpha-1,6-mannosyltransferase